MNRKDKDEGPQPFSSAVTDGKNRTLCFIAATTFWTCFTLLVSASQSLAICIEIFHLDSAKQPFDKIAEKAEESATTPSWENNARMA